MKRIILGLTALLLVVTALVFNACEKQVIMENNQQEQFQTDATLQKILNFKNTVENPTKAENETMLIDSAVWYIEALLNFEYCIKTDDQVKAGANVIIVDSIFNNVIVEDDQLPIATVISTYFKIENHMANILAKYQFDVKFYDIVNIEYKNESLVAYFSIRYKDNIEKSGFLYNITSDWYWGYDEYRAGQCDGTEQGKDAVTEINKWVSQRVPVTANVYYTDVDKIGYFNTAEDYNINGTNISSYGINMFSFEVNEWLPGQQTDEYIATIKCLSASIITNYALESLGALSVIENNFINQNEDITLAKLHGDIYAIPYPTHKTNLYHNYEIWAGTRNIYIPK